VLLVFRHLAGARDLSQALLVSFWALQIVYLGQQMGLAARQYPPLRNTVARLLEPLRGDEEDRPAGRGGGAENAGRPRGPAVRFEGVRVIAGGHVILDGVDLAIEAGSRVAIVGASGAGKSTLVGLLLGWHAPAAGRVLVDSVPLDAGTLAALRQHTAWVDPAVQLWNAPLLHNLLYGSYGSPADGDGLLGRAVEASDLRPLLEELPAGLQNPLGEGGGLVSGGEGQRVRLGRALMRPEARLVVLDEPFRGLDHTARRRLLDRARAWWPRATLLCVTHDIEQTLPFDRVAVMEGGRVIELGCPGELAARRGSRYRDLLDQEIGIRRRFEPGAGWRRLRLAAGRLVDEEPGPAGGPRDG
jgi:ABC-type multidrug transport system fused ATPase/permease subunit